VIARALSSKQLAAWLIRCLCAFFFAALAWDVAVFEPQLGLSRRNVTGSGI